MKHSLTDGQIFSCVEAAVRAPSIHNTQPWLFLPDDDRIEVHADPSRRLPAIDPHSRALHISLGAAILNLKMAMAALGYRPHVALLPTPGDSRHVATVIAAGAHHPDDDDLGLVAAIPLRCTNRHPFADTPPSPECLIRLETAALTQGAILQITDPLERDALLSLARTADTRWRADPAYRDELRIWTTDDPYRDEGVPLNAIGPWSGHNAIPIRDFALDRDVPGRATQPFESDPTVAALSAIGHDTPANWLRTGQALERVLLQATRDGLATSLFTQPLEYPDLRELLTDPSGRTSLQAILRIGYGPTVPPTPRRAPHTVITRTRPVPLRPRTAG